MISLAGQEYWNRSYEGVVFRESDDRDPLARWLREHVPSSSEGTALEIGCYPGAYSAILGELGYELHGIDRVPGTAEHVPSWLRSLRHRVGVFQEADFFEADLSKYDLVASFGFIEHFADWKSVLRRQAQLVRKGGRIVVTTPNYRGAIQNVFHRFLDEQGYARHNIDSMNPESWPSVLGDEWQVEWLGHFGGFQFSFEEQSRTFAQRALIELAFRTADVTRRFVKGESRHYSQACGLVARLAE